MRRVLFYRLYEVEPARLSELEQEARTFARARAWRGDAFWLATERSTDLFAMEYFRHARNEEGAALSAAGFVRMFDTLPAEPPERILFLQALGLQLAWDLRVMRLALNISSEWEPTYRFGNSYVSRFP